MKEQKYHINLATYFQSKPLYLDGDNFKKPNVRKLEEQPWQELEAAKLQEILFDKNKDAKIKEEREKLWDNVTNTLCNLDFIQAKAAAKFTYELVNNFIRVMDVIPDNVENIRKEKEHKVRMERYTENLIKNANSDINEFDIPESIAPWPGEKVKAEIERLRTQPSRIDRLTDFMSFLA
ncbi:MAG: hypothetical protein K8R67_02845 [Desulfobacteraceae bacterium]|nr:hypothetical protein [Desulfobacteraceae bacterium]